MATKTWLFEELPVVDDIELELDYSYSYDAGRYSGPPEDCYPAEEDSEINLPAGYEGVIMAACMKAARAAIKAIEARVEEMNDDGLPREWEEEAAADWADDFADSEYHRLKEAA